MKVILKISIFFLIISNIALTFPASQLQLSSIEKTLLNSEANYSDIVNGANKTVRWFNGTQQTEFSIIYLHGFSASRQELNPVIDSIADNLGANVFYTRLAGHGRSDDAMITGSPAKWLADTREAYDIGALIGKKVIVISTSTGGTLATWLITQSFSKDLFANVMISPNYATKNKVAGIVRWSWGLKFAKWRQGNYYSFKPYNELHAQYWTERYPFEALVPMFALLDLVKDIDKSKTTVPQLVIYSPSDQVISVKAIEKTLKEFNNSEVDTVRYKNSNDPAQHVLAGNACSPQSNEEVTDLISNYLITLSAT